MVFPDVPPLPGVPPLPRLAGTVYPMQVAATDNATAIDTQPALWGVFDQTGAPVAVSDSFVGMGFHDEARVPDYQIEDGAFAAYNKVELPFIGNVTLACGGDAVTRENFITALRTAKKSLDMFTIITPDGMYPNANIVELDWRRTAENGAYMIIADIKIKEIRIVSAQYTRVAQQPSGASPVNDGKIQPNDPTPQQTSVLQDIIDKYKAAKEQLIAH